MCKKIHRGGNAEQYNADKKYKEAVAVAVEACAEDTKGQTCFICTQALHWKTKEGLVRGCACRGTAGFAHVSCLAEQAKILHAEAEENNLGPEVMDERWARWYSCSLCEQHYHGVVQCALGWACWKSYVGRPEADRSRRLSMNVLCIGLGQADRLEEELGVVEACLAIDVHIGTCPEQILVEKGNLANCYDRLGRKKEALALKREVLAGHRGLYGTSHEDSITAANNLCISLIELGLEGEAKSLARKNITACRRSLGDDHVLTFRAQSVLARAIAIEGKLEESVALSEELYRRSRRVLGDSHPETQLYRGNLAAAKLEAELTHSRTS